MNSALTAKRGTPHICAGIIGFSVMALATPAILAQAPNNAGQIGARPDSNESQATPQLVVQKHPRSYDFNAALFSPDGATLLLGVSNGNAQVMEAQTGDLRKTIVHFGKRFVASPDGGRIASVWGRTVKLWDGNNIQLQRVLEDHQGEAYGIAFSLDGKILASSSIIQEIPGPPMQSETILWDVESGKRLNTVLETDAEIVLPAFSPDGKTLATSSAGRLGDIVRGTLKLWDVSTGTLLHTMEEHRPAMAAPAFSPDGQLLAAVGTAGGFNNLYSVIRLWNIKTRILIKTIPLNNTGWGTTYSIRFAKDGNLLVNDIVLDLQTSTTFSLPATDNKAAVLATNERQMVRKDHRNVWLEDVATGERIKVWHDAYAAMRQIKFSPDATTLATSYSRGADIKLWDIQTATLRHSLYIKGHVAPSFIFSSDGSKLLVSGGNYPRPGIWDTQTGEMIRDLETTNHQSGAMAWSSDDELFARAIEGGVELWNIRTGTLLRTWPHRTRVLRMAFSSDARMLATLADVGVTRAEISAGESGNLRLWDTTSGDLLASQSGQHKAQQIFWDGDSITIVDGNGRFKAWDWKNNVLQDNATGAAPPWGGRITAISSDHQLIAATNWRDFDVRLSNIQTGQLLYTLSGHLNEVKSAAFSPDGKLFATGTANGDLHLWRVADGKRLVTISLLLDFVEEGYFKHEWIAYTPEGYYAGSARAANFIRWRVGDQLFPAEKYEADFHRPQNLHGLLKNR